MRSRLRRGAAVLAYRVFRWLNAAPPPAGPGSVGDAGATITPYEDGPLLVRGRYAIRTRQGEEVDPRRATVALCRCGKSATKPFCDGTHKMIGFRARDLPR